MAHNYKNSRKEPRELLQIKDFVNGSRKWKNRIFETDIRKISF